MSASLCEVRTFRTVIYIFLLNVEKRNRSSTDAVYPLNWPKTHTTQIFIRHIYNLVSIAVVLLIIDNFKIVTYMHNDLIIMCRFLETSTNTRNIKLHEHKFYIPRSVCNKHITHCWFSPLLFVPVFFLFIVNCRIYPRSRKFSLGFFPNNINYSVSMRRPLMFAVLQSADIIDAGDGAFVSAAIHWQHS